MQVQKINSKISQQQMTDLSAANVTVSRGFVYTRLDYCDPFDVKKCTARSKHIKKKVFIYIYVCFTTKSLKLSVI